MSGLIALLHLAQVTGLSLKGKLIIAAVFVSNISLVGYLLLKQKGKNNDY